MIPEDLQDIKKKQFPKRKVYCYPGILFYLQAWFGYETKTLILEHDTSKNASHIHTNKS